MTFLRAQGAEVTRTVPMTQKTQSPNDQRSDVKNPNNPQHGQADGNRGGQMNPQHPDYQGGRGPAQQPKKE